MTCLFCRGVSNESSQSHVLPASLGGEDWACLPEGVVCSRCNQYFGTKVEAQALGSFPFICFRILLGIPTRKKKAPHTETVLGTMRAAMRPGTVGIDPRSDVIEQKLVDGEIRQLRILAEVTEPLAIARMLLKMALETVALDDHKLALSSQFDEARRFARDPQTNTSWWFLLHVNHRALFSRISAGITAREWSEGVSMSTVPIEDSEFFHLKLLDISAVIPMESRIQPPPLNDLPQPDYRLCHAHVCREAGTRETDSDPKKDYGQ
jgi:HNH endonuclease